MTRKTISIGAIAALLAGQAQAEGMPPVQEKFFNAYRDCLINAVGVLAETSKESAEAVIQATYGVCYEQGEALRNITRAIGGQVYADAFIEVTEKRITPQLMFGVITLRTVQVMPPKTRSARAQRSGSGGRSRRPWSASCSGPILSRGRSRHFPFSAAPSFRG